MLPDTPFKCNRFRRIAGVLLMLGSALTINLLSPGHTGAQESIDAYARGRLFEAYSHFWDDSLDVNEKDFLLAASLADADSAVEIYRQIVLRAPEAEIAKLATEKIRQYYYAQGLYTRAQEIGETLGDWQPPPRKLRATELTPPPPFVIPDKKEAPPEVVEEETPVVEEEPEPAPPQKSAFSLQVGAFRSGSNANKLKKQLEGGGYTVQVQSPEESGSNLYMVRVVGFDSVSTAFDAAEAIKDKFNIQPIVVPGE